MVDLLRPVRCWTAGSLLSDSPWGGCEGCSVVDMALDGCDLRRAGSGSASPLSSSSDDAATGEVPSTVRDADAPPPPDSGAPSEMLAQFNAPLPALLGSNVNARSIFSNMPKQCESLPIFPSKITLLMARFISVNSTVVVLWWSGLPPKTCSAAAGIPDFWEVLVYAFNVQAREV